MYEDSSLNNIKSGLSSLAPILKENLESLKRPLVIEFAGTPKSGKTLCVDAIAKYFRRHDIAVSIITERASICPIKNKHHLFFNIWTGCASLIQMLEALEKPASVIILDRGIFDSLVWIDFLTKWNSVTPDELISIQNFFLLDCWAKKIDIIVAMSVDPDESLRREFKDQITDTEGSIMNVNNLRLYNDSLHSVLEKYKHNFCRILISDTTITTPVEGVARIAEVVIQAVDNLSDNEIAVVDRELLVTNYQTHNIVNDSTIIKNYLSYLLTNIKWVRRSVAEKDLSLVQIIPVATFQKDGELLILNVRGNKQGRMENKNCIWAGGHIYKSDLSNQRSTCDMFRTTLVRELDEELNFRVVDRELSKLPDAIIWDTSEPKSNQHLGIFFEYKIPANKPKEILDKREFWETKFKSLFTEFVPISENLSRIEDLEAWSKIYLHNKFGIDFKILPKQSRFL